MKKSIIALMGLFTLVACSEDVYQDADKMNENGTVENTDPQNSVKTVDSGTLYESPYGTSDRFEYVFQNDTPFNFTFTPWVQICFFDGVNDISHYSNVLPSSAGGTIPLINTLISLPSSNEYSIYLGARPIKMAAYTTETIPMGGGGLILPASPSGPTTASGQYFNFDFSAGGLVAPPTPMDMQFYGRYLKFVGLEGSVKASDGSPVEGATLRFPFGPHMSLQNMSAPSSANWTPVPMPAGYTTGEDRYFHNVTKEVISTDVVQGSIAQRDSFKSFVYNGVTYTLSLYTTRDKIVVLLK